MKAIPEISFRRTVTTGSTFQWHRMGCNTCLLVWHIQPAQPTQSVTSGRTTAVFKSTDKVTAFKAKLELWGRRVNIGIFDMFQTLAEILKETEQGPSFSQLVHDHLSQLWKEFEHYFPTTKDPQTGKEWICYPFVNKLGESTLSMLEEDQLLGSQMTVTLKCVWDNFKSPYVLD